MEFLVLPQSTHSLVECFSAGGDGCGVDDCTFTCTPNGDICACKYHDPCNNNNPCSCYLGYYCGVRGCQRNVSINGSGITSGN